MRRVAQRSLTKNGNSYTVSIPREFIEELRLGKGALLDIIRDDDNTVLTVRRAKRRTEDEVEIAASRGVRPLFG